MKLARINLYDLTRPMLFEAMEAAGHRPFHGEAIWRGLYRSSGFAELRDVPQLLASIPPAANPSQAIPAAVSEWFLQHTELMLPTEKTKVRSSDGYTEKYLLCPSAATPEIAIETVCMAFDGQVSSGQEEGAVIAGAPTATPRFTACVSSQAGCAMGCVFCATGQMGFKRHLSTGEIVAQVLHVIRALNQRGEQLRNIVFMGMGEPLHNFDAVMRAVEILSDPHGLALAPRHITVSTVGLPKGIRRLALEGPPVRLAVSLHGASQSQRLALVPVAKKWKLDEVLEACRYYCDTRKRGIFFEWALIAGENDQPEQAHVLGQLLKDMPAKVNVIPLNPTGGFEGSPSQTDAVRAFCQVLNDYGIRSTIRQRRGIDVDAGCGQLALRAES